MKFASLTSILTILIMLPLSLFGNEPIAVGEPAPAMTVTTDTGDQLDLAALYKKGPVLVYFYPRAGTSGCTVQACNLRDNFSEIQSANVTILGVSTDDVEALQKFRSDESLPFSLISDSDRKLGSAFKVDTFMGMGYKRQSFLVLDGKIAWRDLSARPASQSQDALAALKTLSE